MDRPQFPASPLTRTVRYTPMTSDPIATRSEKPVARREILIDFVVLPIVLLALLALIVGGQEHVIELITRWQVDSWYISVFFTILEIVGIDCAMQRNKRRKRR